MSKRTYRAKNIKDVDLEKLISRVEGRRIAVGVDVAKTKFHAALVDEERRIIVNVKWEHPQQTNDFVALIKALPSSLTEVVMEPSGTYGDALRYALLGQDIPVFRVSAKRTHDAKEVYDGVPSKHDAKDAVIIARLRLDGAGQWWPMKNDLEGDLSAALSTLDIFQGQYVQNLNRLEACSARHWPELSAIIDLDTSTVLVLLRDIGGPADVVKNLAKARKLMTNTGGSLLSQEKIDAVIASASATIGVPVCRGEKAALKALAADALRAKKECRRARIRLEKLSSGNATLKSMGEVVGKCTAAVLFSEVGDPLNYKSAAAYEKSAGLNIIEHSSGKHQGRRKISKRGSGMARRWLFLAALRLINQNSVVRAWHERKIAREGGKRKMLSVVAIMRKYIRALWHVAHGAVFDPTLKYDLERLGL